MHPVALFQAMNHYKRCLYTKVEKKNEHNSLVAKRGPRAPPGQINETNFFRLRIVCRKRILMLPENIFGRQGVFRGLFEVTSV